MINWNENELFIMIIEKFSASEILKIESLTENEFYIIIIEINGRNEYLKIVN